MRGTHHQLRAPLRAEDAALWHPVPHDYNLLAYAPRNRRGDSVPVGWNTGTLCGKCHQEGPSGFECLERSKSGKRDDG